MSKNVLFISVEVLKERTATSGNIYPKLIYPDIKAAQDLYIHPILGTALYKRLQTGIDANDLTDDEKELLNDYIVDTLAYYTLMELPEGLSYQYTNKGVVRKTSDSSETVSMDDLIALSYKYKNRAEHYAKRLMNYLKDEATETKFPEYLNAGTGNSTIHPSGSTFTIPIPLDDDCGCRGGWDDYKYYK